MEKLLEAIADNWGGKDCPRKLLDNGVFAFGRPGDFIYWVYLPGQDFPVFEDSGEPCGTVLVVPGDSVYVRCINDAPDAWFRVDVDGTYRGFGFTDPINLLEAK